MVCLLLLLSVCFYKQYRSQNKIHLRTCEDSRWGMGWGDRVLQGGLGMLMSINCFDGMDNSEMRRASQSFLNTCLITSCHTKFLYAVVVGIN